MEKFLEDRLNELKKIEKYTPLCFKLEQPLNILYSFDEVTLYNVIQFDQEIKAILESFLAVCYTASILYDNIDFIELGRSISSINSKAFLKHISLSNTLRLIAVYFESYKFPTNISEYTSNIIKLSNILKCILDDAKKLRDQSTDIYMFEMLNNNIGMLEEDIDDNKRNLRIVFKKLLRDLCDKLSFGEYFELMTQYCLLIYNQDSLFSSTDYFDNIYKFIKYFEINNELAQNIVKGYEEFKDLKFENMNLQRKLFNGQNDQSLI